MLCYVLQVAQERIQIQSRVQADFDTSAQCRMEALQCVVGSTAIVAYTQAFWTYRALGDPLSVDIRDQLLKPAGVRRKLRLDVGKSIQLFQVAATTANS